MIFVALKWFVNKYKYDPFWKVIISFSLFHREDKTFCQKI